MCQGPSRFCVVGEVKRGSIHWTRARRPSGEVEQFYPTLGESTGKLEGRVAQSEGVSPLDTNVLTIM
jgi:hypothetical protein